MDHTDNNWVMAGGGFAKLYGPALAGSSLMDTSVNARWLFVYLLACADSEGRFHAQTESTLARLANLPQDQIGAAVAELEAPDEQSRTKEFEGRRIERIPGGWKILNYEKYRDYRTKKQVYMSQYMSNRRKGKQEQEAQ